MDGSSTRDDETARTVQVVSLDLGAAEAGPVELSVVIACRNGAATLGEQLDALAGQTCPVPFEVVLADNGSTDRSIELALGFADRLPVRVVDASAVRGPAHARNRGVEEASGRLVAFCDADDVVADDWLAAVVAALAGHEFVAGRVDVTYLNSSRVASSRSMAQRAGLQESGTALRLRHAGAGNMAVHRDVFRSVGGFDETLESLEDSDLCWRIQLAGTPLHYCPDMLIRARLRATLPGVARQGYAYGRSFAALERRYGVAAAESGPDRPRLRGRLARVAALGPWGVIWHLAWHLGHRRGVMTPPTVESPPGPAVRAA